MTMKAADVANDTIINNRKAVDAEKVEAKYDWYSSPWSKNHALTQIASNIKSLTVKLNLFNFRSFDEFVFKVHLLNLFGDSQ